MEQNLYYIKCKDNEPSQYDEDSFESEWSNVGHSSNLLLEYKRHQSFFSNTRQDLFTANPNSQYFGKRTKNCKIGLKYTINVCMQ